MKKYEKRIVLLSILIGILFVGWNIYGSFKDSVTVTNQIKMGDVNIGIQEYEIKNGREILYENSKIIFPGDTVSKIPRIINYAEPCWIRVKLLFESEDQKEGLAVENISGISEKWRLIGDYYYYTEILDYREHVDFFEKVSVPKTWTEEHNAQKLNIQIKAEAIQAANIEPDFSAMSPWGNEEIEICVHEENGISACIKEEMELHVEFNGQAHKLLAVPNNFFHNIKRAMPGDCCQDQILLKNTTEKNAELFFRTEVKNQTKIQTDLLKQIRLKIFIGQQILYEGNLYPEELNKNVSLGIYEPGMTGNLEFEISIPKELKNDYALRDAGVNWIFSVDEDETEAYENGLNNEAQKNAVKTGDMTPILSFALLTIVAGCGVIVIICWKKKGERHEK